MPLAVSRARQLGLSLIELMVSIAVFTILATMAFPVYSTWLAGLQVRTATESVVDGLHVTQAEAVKRSY